MDRVRKNHNIRLRSRGMVRGLLIGLTIPGLVGAVVAGTATHARAQLVIEYEKQDDIFIGKNTPGPYTLAWNNLRVGRDEPVSVTVDGKSLRPDEYTLDVAKGLITFRKSLSDKSITRVTYFYDQKAAKRNTGVATAPLTLPVTRFGQTSLNVIALPNGGDPNKSGAGTPLIWTMGGKTNLLGGGLNSEFRYAGDNKTNLRLGFNRGNDRNGMDVQYSQNDKDFATGYGKSLGLADPLQRHSLAARLAPSKYLGTSFSTSETKNLLSKEEKAQDIYALRVGGVGKQPTLNYTRTEDTTTAPDRKETNVTTDKVDVAARLDRMTAVSASTTTTQVEMPNPDANATARDTVVSLNSAADGGAKQAVATLNKGIRETKNAMEEKKALSVRLQPAPVFVLSAARAEQKVTPVKPDGTTGTPNMVMTQSAGAEIVPMTGTKLTSTITETTTNDVKVSATNFAAEVKAGKNIDFLTATTNRSSEAEGNSPLDTTRTQINLRPAQNLTLTGACIWNPEENGQVKQALRQEIGMKASFGAIELGSGYALTTLNGMANADDIDPQFGQFNLSLGWRFSRFTRLNGAYLDSLRYRSAGNLTSPLIPRYLRTYNVGFTHDIGPGFNLGLGGTVTEGRSKANQPRDITAEARVGVKF